MKRIILTTLVIGIFLLSACGTPTYTLNTSVSPSGAGSVSPSGGQYEPGVQVTLTATPASGYTFDYWGGDASGSSATITIIMDSNKSIIAHFADTTPPVISGADISHVTESRATIKWETDELATSQVEYGTSDAYGSITVLDEKLTTSHSVTLTELKPETTYHFRVKSQDAATNESVSEDYTFVTQSLLDLDIPYTAKSGVTVTVHEITVTEKAGFNEYYIRYTLENNTSDKVIDEGSFKIYFKGGGGEPQYGSFSRLFPSEHIARSYTWKVLKTEEVYLIEFEGDFFSAAPGTDTLKWGIPH